MPSATITTETTTHATEGAQTIQSSANGQSSKGSMPSSTMNGVNGRKKPVATYQVWDQPIGTIKPMRVICIGAGASGINMAYQAKNFLERVDLVIYEKNQSFGGTWFENRYPGCKCDIREFRLTL